MLLFIMDYFRLLLTYASRKVNVKTALNLLNKTTTYHKTEDLFTFSHRTKQQHSIKRRTCLRFLTEQNNNIALNGGLVYVFSPNKTTTYHKTLHTIIYISI